jgi:heat shock protein HtpX
VLLGFVGVVPRFGRVILEIASEGLFGLVGAVVIAALCVPPAFVIGWITRLSVLGMSRAREFSADAAAATLTGRPSALASALLKLESQRDWAPRSDLRQFYAQDVLCIVGTEGRGLGRLFSTHPRTAARVKRLEAMEGRMQREPARL